MKRGAEETNAKNKKLKKRNRRVCDFCSYSFCVSGFVMQYRAFLALRLSAAFIDLVSEFISFAMGDFLNLAPFWRDGFVLEY